MEQPDLFSEPPALPALPYAGTSGWSGSAGSRERALSADASGETSARQRRILALLGSAGEAGLTWKQVADATGLHHGSASGALSALHRESLICRLEERRGRCHIYVLPDHIAGRIHEPYSPNPGSRNATLALLDQIEDALCFGDLEEARAIIRGARERLA